MKCPEWGYQRSTSAESVNADAPEKRQLVLALTACIQAVNPRVIVKNPDSKGDFVSGLTNSFS